MAHLVDLRLCHTAEDFAAAHGLFLEYARELDMDLCFQGFEKELKELHVQYNHPGGALFLLTINNELAGCAGIRRISDQYCELKRMYIRAFGRGKGYGGWMLQQAVKKAALMGYRMMRLDTLPSMQQAIALYRSRHFVEIPAYRENPVQGAIYFERELSDQL